MKKIINPCSCEVYRGTANAFVSIEYDEEGGRLSLRGVVGPMSNCDCKGSAGQCVDAIRNGTPANVWTPEMLQKLCDIWDRWHLNDMRPYCQHQKDLGWDKIAGEKITLHHYRLTDEANKRKKAAENAAMDALRKGETFTPSEEQAFFAGLEYGLETFDSLSEEIAPHYQPKKPLYPGDHGPTETKMRGWVRCEESDLGILCKPCPVCGYKYGTSWLKEEVPQDVLDWLFALPETERRPAWI